MGSSDVMGCTSPQAPRQYGITKAISTAGPTEVDLQRTRELEKFLVDAGLYESNEEAAKREEILREIDKDANFQLFERGFYIVESSQ